MRPAIDPANINRAQTRPRIRRTTAKWVAVYITAIAVAVVFVHVFDPALNPFI